MANEDTEYGSITLRSHSQEQCEKLYPPSKSASSSWKSVLIFSLCVVTVGIILLASTSSNSTFGKNMMIMKSSKSKVSKDTATKVSGASNLDDDFLSQVATELTSITASLTRNRTVETAGQDDETDEGGEEEETTVKSKGTDLKKDEEVSGTKSKDKDGTDNEVVESEDTIVAEEVTTIKSKDVKVTTVTDVVESENLVDSEEIVEIVAEETELHQCTDTKFSFDLARDGYDVLDFFSANKSNTVKYKFLDGFDAVIEPYANSTLKYHIEDVSCSSLSYFTFLVIGSGHQQLVKSTMYVRDSQTSDPFVVECSPFDEVQITVKAFSDDGDQIGTTVMMDAMCMYVRREIRELTSSDLDRTMDAMYTIWVTNEEDGQALYGENYHDAIWFASVHDFNAAWQDSDHIHEGLGFLPQHNKISNYFELAMQAVDPSVSLFYWDFTIDRADHLTIYESPMFQASTFGSLTPPTDPNWGWTYAYDSISDAHIPDGRWKNLDAIPSNPSFVGIINGFGYMRGPWSMNPSSKMTRFAHDSTYVPKCTIYYEWLQMNEYNDFMTNAEDAPHASTHGTIGGVYGCDALIEMLDAGYIKDTDSILDICSKWSFYLKEWYRGNFLTPKTSCTTDEKNSYKGTKCGFECNDGLADDMITAMQSISLSKFVPEDMSDEGWQSWRDFVCTGNGYRIFTGDHLESASTADPSFWPIHPTQERLLQLKYMTKSFSNWTWPTSAKGSYVCNHANCYEDPDGSRDYYDECCYGHFENDQLLDFSTGVKAGGFGPTNREILDGTDPTNSDYSMTYIYSNFDFSHCDEDFDELVETLAAGSKS